MMITYCAGCATPLGTTDSSCPSCGATATPQRAAAAAAGRQPILGPVTAAATGTGTSATPSPAPLINPALPGDGGVRPPRRSPVGAAVSRAGRSGRLAAAGTITGPVTCARIAATGTGQRLLALAAGVIAAVALATLMVVGGIAVTVSVLMPLLPGLLVLGFLLLILKVAAMRAGSSLERELSTEVRRFRVTEVSGRQVACELVGELAGAQLQQGDIVDVFGRAARRATVRVRAVVVTSNQARITARPGFGFVLARIANVAAVTLSAACVIGVAYLLVTR